MKIFWLFLILLFMFSCQSDTKNKNDVESDIYSYPSQLLIENDKNDEVLRITHSGYHYKVILPYMPDLARVSSEYGGFIISDNSGKKSVSFSRGYLDEAPATFITEYKVAVDKKGITGLIGTDMIKYENSLILKIIVKINDNKATSKYDLFYLIAKKWHSDFYLLQYKEVVSEIELKDYDEKAILRHLHKDFAVNYMRRDIPNKKINPDLATKLPGWLF